MREKIIFLKFLKFTVLRFYFYFSVPVMDRRNRQVSLQHKSNEFVDDEVFGESAHENHSDDGQKRENSREEHNKNVRSKQGGP